MIITMLTMTIYFPPHTHTHIPIPIPLLFKKKIQILNSFQVYGTITKL